MDAEEMDCSNLLLDLPQDLLSRVLWCLCENQDRIVLMLICRRLHNTLRSQACRPFMLRVLGPKVVVEEKCLPAIMDIHMQTLRRGSPFEPATDFGYDALTLAITHGWLQGVARLIKLDNTLCSSSVFALATDNTEMLSLLYDFAERIAGDNKYLSLCHTSSIYGACGKGNLDALKLVHNRFGVTVHTPGVSFSGSLMCLSFKQNMESIEYLCSAFDLNRGNYLKDARQAFYYASTLQMPLEIIKFIQRQFQLTADDVCVSLTSSFFVECRGNRLDVVRFMCEEMGITSEHIREHSPKLMGELTHYGALDVMMYLHSQMGVTRKDFRRGNALSIACGDGNTDIVHYLISYVGLNGDDVSKHNYSAMRRAMECGSLQIVRLLFDCSMHLFTPAHKNTKYKLLLMACEQSNTQIVEFVYDMFFQEDAEFPGTWTDSICERLCLHPFIDNFKFMAMVVPGMLCTIRSSPAYMNTLRRMSQKGRKKEFVKYVFNRLKHA